MANSSQVLSDITIFSQTQVAKKVKNTLFNAMPTLDMLFRLNGDKTNADGLGRPKSGVLVAGVKGGAGFQRESIMAARTYKPIVQTFKPLKSEIKVMTDYDNNPVVPNWGTTNAQLNWFTEPRFRFHREKQPLKVAKSAIRTAKSNATTEGQAAKAIGSLYDVELTTRMAVLCENLNDQLWELNGKQGYPTSEDALTWDNIHSFKRAIGTTTNTYGGVDRSVAANAYWLPNVISTNTRSFADQIDYMNYDLGMLDKNQGVQIIAVGKALMKKAKAEAKAETYQLVSPNIKENAEFGFLRETVIIHSGNRPVYVFYDPSIAAGEWVGLDPSTWTVAITPDFNFKVDKWRDSEETEDGDEAYFSRIGVELMVACEVPSGNAYGTGWT